MSAVQAMSDTGEIIKVYEVANIDLKTKCPDCGRDEQDCVWISANERYVYCLKCAIEWIARGLNWEGK